MSHAARGVYDLPLQRLGELPPEPFLAFIAGLSPRMRDQLIEKWSAQLGAKNKAYRGKP